VPTLGDVVPAATRIALPLLLLALVASGGCLLTFGSWRVSLMALLLQYVVVALMVLNAAVPQVALAQALVGALVCLILYLSERRATELRHQPAEPMWGGRAFRLLAAFVGLLAAWTFAERWALPVGSFGQSLALYWLATVAVLCSVLAKSPLRSGMGLMGLLAGVALFYLFLEESFALVAMFSVVQLLTALVIAYLEVAAASPHASTPRGGA
jgi:multisubunit Na+/H+ antiporter MnhB subunit